MRKIKVLALRVMERPQVEELEADLKTYQKFVGGLIQSVPVDDNVDLICNDEGKLLGLPLNRPLWGGQDWVAGNCFVVAADDAGEFVSLSEDQIAKYTEQFEGFCLSV